MSKPKPSRDCEIDHRDKQHALYVDDFESVAVWKDVCNMLGVPTNADQIYFNATDVAYGK